MWYPVPALERLRTGVYTLQKGIPMVMQRWGSVLLMLVFVLAACGTADTSDIALSDTGVEPSATADGAYPTAQNAAPIATRVPTQEATSAPTSEGTATIPSEALIPLPLSNTLELTAQHTIILNQSINTLSHTLLLTPTHIIKETDVKLKVFTWSFDGKYLVVGRSQPGESTYELSLLDVQTKQEIVIAQQATHVIASPSAYEFVFIQPASSNTNEAIFWSLETQTSKNLGRLENSIFTTTPLSWNLHYGLIHNDEETGNLLQIDHKNGKKDLLKTVPAAYTRTDPSQIVDLVPAPKGDHSYLLERQWREGSATLSFINNNTVLQTYQLGTIKHQRGGWTPQGTYIQIYPAGQQDGLLNLYTSNGTHMYQIEIPDASMSAKTWGMDDRYVVYEAYGLEGRTPYGTFILDLQAHQTLQLPLSFEDRQVYTYLDTAYTWSPTSPYLAVSVVSHKVGEENMHSLLTLYQLTSMEK